MTRFAYIALRADGTNVDGEVEAASELAALDKISELGLTPVSIRDGGLEVPWWQRDIGFSPSADDPSLRKFLASFAALLSAGLPLTRALGYCQKQSEKQRFGRALADLRSDVENGATLREALAGQKDTFPAYIVSLLALGEESNRLPEIAVKAAEDLDTRLDRRRRIQSALIYPAILLVLSLVVLAVVMFFLAPTLRPVFESAGGSVPPLIRFLDDIGMAIRSDWPVVALFVALLLGLGRLAIKSLSVSAARLALRLPVLGGVLVKQQTQTMCQAIGLLLESGATLNEALNAAKSMVGIEPYRDLLTRVEASIVSGGTLSSGFAASKLVDPMAMSLIEAGEEADDLKGSFEKAAELLDGEVRLAIDRAIGAITPVLTIVVGFAIGGVILTTIGAILDLNDLAF